MNIDLNTDAMKELVSKAIFDGLTPEKRDELVRGAIASLLAPSTQQWDRGKSPLQVMFENSVGRIAQDLVTKHLEEDGTLKADIEAICINGARKAFESETVRDKLAEGMANVIRNSLKGY